MRRRKGKKQMKTRKEDANREKWNKKREVEGEREREKWKS